MTTNDIHHGEGVDDSLTISEKVRVKKGATLTPSRPVKERKLTRGGKVKRALDRSKKPKEREW